MNFKIKVIGLLTICLIFFQVIPLIAKDSNSVTLNDPTMYQQSLKENTATNQAINTQTPHVDNEKAKTQLESMNIGNTSSVDIREQEPNDKISQANILLLDQIIRGTITKVDLDYSKITIPQAGSLRILGAMGQNTYFDENHFFLMGLEDSSGRSLSYSDFYQGGNTYGQKLEIKVQPGTYYIVALQRDNSPYYDARPYALIATLTPNAADVHPTSVSLNKSSTSLVTGTTEQLVATVYPSNATNNNVTWTSSNTSIATVDSTGLVKAVSPGTNVKITVSTTDGNFKAYCYVTVTSPTKTVKTLSADPSSLNLAIDEDDYITLTATYTDGTREDVTESATWVSTNPQLATVDDYGTVTGLANGSTTITGTYGGKTATIPVTVNDGSTPVLVGIIAQPDSVYVGYLKTQAVKIYAEYSNDTRVDVTTLATLESLEPTIASVTRGTITGLCVGDTSISVTYLNETTDISVTVTPPVTKLTADPPVLSLLIEESGTIELTATFRDKTEDVVTEFATWKSSNPKIATVDEYGEVTGQAIGSTTITGSYGGKTATIKVNVTPEIDHFIVKPGCVGVAKGKTQVINIYAVYADEDNTVVDITKMVQLTSDDTDVATVKGTTVKGIQADSDTILTGTYLGQDLDIEIPVKVTQPLKMLETDTGTSGLNLSIDDYETIVLSATYADGYYEEVSDCATGISSKPGVATVDIEDGVITVTAVKTGSAKITLSYEGKKVIVNVKVTD